MLRGPVIMLVSAIMMTSVASGPAGQPSSVIWRLDNLQQIGGHPVTIVGKPRLVDTVIGRAIAFDGRGDGLFLDVNPLAGLARFTVEILFQPAPDGAEEQRFLHFEEAVTGNRVLIELRRRPDTRWALDTYLRSGETGLTLLDRERAHPAGRWHVGALTFDGRSMTHYVDGRRELSDQTNFAPLGAGRTSIGTRQNRVSWFKGLIHSIRVTPGSLPAGKLMTVPTHTAEDRSVLLEHSLLFYQAARRAGVPAELHLYQRGPHGFGTRDDLGTTSGWVERWLEWLRSLGFLPSPGSPA